jgi:type II secretory pathway component GspD/PulD (secretin)
VRWGRSGAREFGSSRSVRPLDETDIVVASTTRLQANHWNSREGGGSTMQAMRKGVVSALAALLSLAWVPAQDAPATLQQPQALTGARDAQNKDEIRSGAEGDRANRMTLRLKDRDLREVVQIMQRKANVNIIMGADIKDVTVTIDLQDVPWRQALDLVAEQAGCIVTESLPGVLKVEKPPRVYFAFENTDIQKVIDTIGKISGANIVVAPEVKGTITIRLKNIPWRDALDAAVKTLGFVVVEEDRGILRVVPAANIQQDLVTKTIPLRYVRPESTLMPLITSEYIRDLRNLQPLQIGEVRFTLLDTLRGMITPEVGTLEFIQETNAVMVKDTRPVVESVERTIAMIDTEPSQILLDVRFVTTTNDDVLDFGISPGGSGWSASIGLGQIPTRLPFDLGAGGWDDSLIASPGGTGPFADDNFPADTIVPNVVFGALNFQQVSATLRLLKKDARSEIVQAPQIVALDHQTATIFVGEAVRYAQARVEQGQAGGLLLALEEGDESPVNVGFQLLATPHIVPGTEKVIMQVVPQRTALTGTGASSTAPAGFDVFTVGSGTEAGGGSIALPRVASSTLATTVLLKSGQTAVLGGLKTKSETETITRLPLLGDIPLLGHLFKNTQRQNSVSTLLVFITPQIIRSSEDIENSLRRAIEEKIKDHQSSLSQEKDRIFGRGD